MPILQMKKGRLSEMLWKDQDTAKTRTAGPTQFHMKSRAPGLSAPTSQCDVLMYADVV